MKGKGVLRNFEAANRMVHYFAETGPQHNTLVNDQFRSPGIGRSRNQGDGESKNTLYAWSGIQKIPTGRTLIETVGTVIGTVIETVVKTVQTVETV